jgi:hypothetical protein
VGGRKSLKAHRSVDGTWKTSFSSTNEFSLNLGSGEICAYLDNVGSVINNDTILQVHTLSAGNPLLEVMSKVRSVIKLFINPWKLREFEIIINNLGINGQLQYSPNELLEREFPNSHWYNFFRKLFGVESSSKISLYSVVGLNMRILLGSYNGMGSELELMGENLLSLDFQETWRDVGASVINKFIYQVRKNKHLILCEPNIDRTSYTSVFGTPLLIENYLNMMKNMNIGTLFSIYEQGIYDNILQTGTLGDIYETLITRIVNGGKTIEAVFSLNSNDADYLFVYEKINVNNIENSEQLKKDNILKIEPVVGVFYYQDCDGRPWDLIDYMIVVNSSNNNNNNGGGDDDDDDDDEKILIGIQATLGKTHKTSKRGVKMIDSFKKKNNINKYFHVYFYRNPEFHKPTKLRIADKEFQFLVDLKMQPSQSSSSLSLSSLSSSSSSSSSSLSHPPSSSSSSSHSHPPSSSSSSSSHSPPSSSSSSSSHSHPPSSSSSSSSSSSLSLSPPSSNNSRKRKKEKKNNIINSNNNNNNNDDDDDDDDNNNNNNNNNNNYDDDSKCFGSGGTNKNRCKISGQKKFRYEEKKKEDNDDDSNNNNNNNEEEEEEEPAYDDYGDYYRVFKTPNITYFNL